MTTIVSAVEDRISEAASSAMSGVLTWGAKTAAHWAYDEVRQVMRDYPPVAALILSFGALAIVPVTMFTFFSISSFFGLTGIALLVVAALEGVLLLVGGALLAPILMVCLAMAVVITGGLGLTWATAYLANRAWERLGMGTVAHPSTLMERPQSTAEPVIGAIQEVGASLAQAVRTQMEPVA